MIPNCFRFGENADPHAVVVATIRSRVSARKALFHALSRRLSFPDYFGHNFDALLDCLRDLSWLPAGRVVIIHEPLPLLDKATFDIYISVLASAVEKWRESPDRELVVVFPPSEEEAVTAALRMHEAR